MVSLKCPSIQNWYRGTILFVTWTNACLPITHTIKRHISQAAIINLSHNRIIGIAPGYRLIPGSIPGRIVTSSCVELLLWDEFNQLILSRDW